ncbi:hypothetical protein JCM1393_25030 [Clostridium carnis]
MNCRIKELRKALKLSQEEFGKKLGVTGPGISKIESGHRNCTEQMIKLICREFRVDYIWLTTGEGEMFNSSNDNTLELLNDILNGNNEFAKNVLKRLSTFDDDNWYEFESLINIFTNK